MAGGGTQAIKEPVKARIRPWTWSDAVWHYNDGSAAVYPAYEKIDWGKQWDEGGRPV